MKNQKSKTVTWFSHKPSIDAYNIGFDSLETDINPYDSNTDEWYSWNGGYNAKQMNRLSQIELNN